MCGIAGVLGPARSSAPEDVVPMARSLTHRGPDDFGAWDQRFRYRNDDFVVALGHTRLSILDLSALGRQPMTSLSGDVTIAFNGEIYNYGELRSQLLPLGHRFRSNTDTEVVIEAYRAWGLGAFSRFRGMFALALWDETARRLLLLRDRLGIKPLFYACNRGTLAFGSELRALRRHRSFVPEIDRAALGRYLRYGYVNGPETIYSGVRRLLPGSWLAWNAGRIETGRYWRIDEDDDNKHLRSFEGMADRLETLLGDAVEERLISDVPLGAFLSGGIDSSAVVALMQERSASKVRTFSIGFREQQFDEAPHARAIADYLATEHTELYVDRAQAVEVAHDLPELYDEPFGDPSAIPTTLLSRMTRQYVTVALSGDGGDELFAGYARYSKLARLLPLYTLPPSLRRILAGLAVIAPIPSVRHGLGHLRAGSEAELADRLRSFFPTGVLAAACGPEAAEGSQVFREAFCSVREADPVRRARYADASTYLPDDILAKVDRASMSVGLEVRVPLLDHRIVHFALGLPTTVLKRGQETKTLLRAVLYRRVPRKLIERPKHGFGIPINMLLAQQLTEWTRRYLDPKRLAEEGHFYPDGVRDLLALAHRRHPVAVERLWFLLCFQRWFSRNHGGG